MSDQGRYSGSRETFGGSQPIRGPKRYTPGERRARREAAHHYPTPHFIQWCLDHPERVAHRFTPFQWWVLNLAWGGSGCHTNRWVARQIGVPTRVVRETREAAERVAIELVFTYIPAVERWKRGESTKGDRPILAKYRRTKKGRWTRERKLLPPGFGYRMRTKAFSEMADPDSDEPWEPENDLHLHQPSTDD